MGVETENNSFHVLLRSAAMREMRSLPPHTGPQSWRRGSAVVTCRNDSPGRSTSLIIPPPRLSSNARTSLSAECLTSYHELLVYGGAMRSIIGLDTLQRGEKSEFFGAITLASVIRTYSQP